MDPITGRALVSGFVEANVKSWNLRPLIRAKHV